MNLILLSEGLQVITKERISIAEQSLKALKQDAAEWLATVLNLVEDSHKKIINVEMNCKDSEQNILVGFALKKLIFVFCHKLFSIQFSKKL